MPSLITRDDFVRRVFSTSWQVQFSQVDPYGHLNTGAYAQIIADHRALILDEIAKVPSIQLIQRERMAWVFEELSLRFLRPSFYGEKLEVSSWIDALAAESARVAVLMLAQGSRKLKCAARITIRCVDLGTGKPRLHPDSLESMADENPVRRLPQRDEWLAGLPGCPPSLREWLTE